MNLTGGIVLYAVLWFLTLFIVVLIGQRSQQDAGEIVPGTHAGAPADLRLKPKLIWTSVIAAIIWAAIAYVMDHPKWRLSTQTHKVVGIR